MVVCDKGAYELDLLSHFNFDGFNIHHFPHAYQWKQDPLEAQRTHPRTLEAWRTRPRTLAVSQD